MAFETLLFESREAVGVITLNRPQQMNAINGQMLHELSEAIAACESNPAIAAIVLAGNQRSFCAGADVKYVTSFSSLDDFIAFSRQTKETFHKIETAGKPVIAAITGVALGGGLEMALCCDLRVASQEARLGLTETRLGTIPGAGGTQRLTRVVGPALAKELILTGKRISAEEAYRIGLVNAVAPVDQCIEKAVELANQIGEGAPLALRAAKRCINMALEVDLESGLTFETECAIFLQGTEDQREGFRSFAEKRKPVWRGK
ncbi:MAG: enoyl-CoA hydratase-related protein [Clostridia bacterium]|nr:enoyl-CoA hydratase-related protein [Clostridia bacterium]